MPRVASTDPAKELEVVVALMEKILEILATTPEELATSKKASGVVSPSPNLPDEILENLAKAVERELLATISLVKIQPPVTVSSCDKLAGPPSPQSSLTTTSAEPDGVTANPPASKDIVATGFNILVSPSFTWRAEPEPPPLTVVQENRPVTDSH